MINGQDGPDSGAAIRLGDKARDPNETRWGLLLVLFMRTVAFLWVFQGLLNWYRVLSDPNSIFDTTTPAWAGTIVFFGVMDLLAAVGMWLATPWGGVLWLLVALSQMLVAWLMPQFFDGGIVVILLDALLIGLYFLLTFEAGREPSRRSAPRRLATRMWHSSSGFLDRFRR
ncbi:MAG: hypothetical protein KGM42_13900 [Hyphomicrobiales bacterium]|nr:hypothetical protein [Hyphomicrobiales bacterium]